MCYLFYSITALSIKCHKPKACYVFVYIDQILEINLEGTPVIMTGALLNLLVKMDVLPIIF